MLKLKTYRFLQVALAVVLPCNLALAAYLVSNKTDDSRNELQKFRAVLNIVRTYYVDESKVKPKDLVDGAIDGMLRTLDEHSHYLPPKKYVEATERLQGQYGGIGITFSYLQGAFVVQDLLPDGPAHVAGMKRDDRITGVDGEDITKMDMFAARKRIKGPANTVVKLTVQRPSTNKTLEIDVMRQIIKLPSVRNIHLMDDGIAYFHITQFNRRTTKETGKALEELSGKMKGLIIDVRANPGGLLTSAQEVCSYFLPATDAKGLPTAVVTTIPRDKAQEETLNVIPELKKYTQIPIVVLANAQSASAAEILSGCLKDYKRATLVGEKTFGKGSVQREFQLRAYDQSAVRLTVAKYYTPSRVVIHGKGIKPDIPVKVPQKDLLALYRQLNRLESTPRKDDVTDPQLAKAIEVLTQKIKNTPTVKTPEE